MTDTATRITPQPNSVPTKEVAILDAHVHVHACFDKAQFLQATYDNFHAQAKAMGKETAFIGVALLTESFGVNCFSHFSGLTGLPQAGLSGWRMKATSEPMSLHAVNGAGEQVTLIAGRQIVSSERLEILALGLIQEIDDNLPIREIIGKVQSAGALCVLPWGFGKWTGKRGKIVRTLLDNKPGDNFFVGDNAGRLAVWPAPAEFDVAANKGIRMLSGTDPLPWGDQFDSAGRFGTLLDRGLDPLRPFADIRRYLLDESRAPRPYGQLESLLPFIKHQVGMQFRKRAK
jgi:hypothetical protein